MPHNSPPRYVSSFSSSEEQGGAGGSKSYRMRVSQDSISKEGLGMWQALKSLSSRGKAKSHQQKEASYRRVRDLKRFLTTSDCMGSKTKMCQKPMTRVKRMTEKAYRYSKDTPQKRHYKEHAGEPNVVALKRDMVEVNVDLERSPMDILKHEDEDNEAQVQDIFIYEHQHQHQPQQEYTQGTGERNTELDQWIEEDYENEELMDEEQQEQMRDEQHRAWEHKQQQQQQQQPQNEHAGRLEQYERQPQEQEDKWRADEEENQGTGWKDERYDYEQAVAFEEQPGQEEDYTDVDQQQYEARAGPGEEEEEQGGDWEEETHRYVGQIKENENEEETDAVEDRGWEEEEHGQRQMRKQEVSREQDEGEIREETQEDDHQYEQIQKHEQTHWDKKKLKSKYTQQKGRKEENHHHQQYYQQQGGGREHEGQQRQPEVGYNEEPEQIGIQDEDMWQDEVREEQVAVNDEVAERQGEEAEVGEMEEREKVQEQKVQRRKQIYDQDTQLGFEVHAFGDLKKKRKMKKKVNKYMNEKKRKLFLLKKHGIEKEYLTRKKK